jgi:hypothetical protein
MAQNVIDLAAVAASVFVCQHSQERTLRSRFLRGL